MKNQQQLIRPRRLCHILIAAALASLGLAPQAQADCREGCDLSLGNTFLGNDAVMNTTGIANTGVGESALAVNTTGDGNTAVGYAALHTNTTGNDNTAIGVQALGFSTTGSCQHGGGRRRARKQHHGRQ